MNFELVHTLRIPADEYFDVVLSDEFVRWVKDTMKQDERKVVRFEEKNGTIYRTIRSEKTLGAKAQRHFKVPKFVMEEKQEIRRDDGSYTWEYIPNIGNNRFEARGTGVIDACEQGTRLTIEGEVKFRIPLIGKRIEKHTVAWVEQNFHKMLEGLEEFYERGYKGKKE